MNNAPEDLKSLAIEIYPNHEKGAYLVRKKIESALRSVRAKSFEEAAQIVEWECHICEDQSIGSKCRISAILRQKGSG